MVTPGWCGGRCGASLRESIADALLQAKLEREGAILGYRAELSREAAGGEGIRAFLLLRLTRTPATEALGKIRAMHTVRRFYSVTGDLPVPVLKVEKES